MLFLFTNKSGSLHLTPLNLLAIKGLPKKLTLINFIKLNYLTIRFIKINLNPLS